MDIAAILKDLPHSSGVYIMYGASGQILYVGKARDLFKRVHQYFGNKANRTEKVLRLVQKVDDIKYIITRNEVEALVLENNLIKKHKPPYNILLKDDKNYPFVKINLKTKFPRVEVVRRLKNDGSKYFGPYMIGINAKEITDLINSAFCLRECKLDLDNVSANHRPCLNYHIGRCHAPCAGKISDEEYGEIIKEVISFLSGNDKKVAGILTEKMTAAAEAEEYELALTYKQKLAVLDKLVRRQVGALPKDFDLDVFAIESNGLNTVVAVLFVRAGKMVGGDKFVVNDYGLNEGITLSNFIMRFYDSDAIAPDEVVVSSPIEDQDVLQEYLSEKFGKKLNVIEPRQGVRRQLADMAASNARDYLEKSLSLKERQDNMTVGAVIQLAEFLKLERLPQRMECYDISHISGTNKVASMVVFTGGEPDKAAYRKFRIKTVAGNDDFACLQETLTRRLTELKNGSKDESLGARPDLIVIDGGKGQLSSVMEIVADLGVTDIPFISLAKREEEVFLPGKSEPVILPRNSYALKLLQRIRDEAHRFAITFHRQLRKKSQTVSELLSVPGVGKKRVGVLFKHFGTIDNIRNADVEQLACVPGMTRPAAEAVYAFYHAPDKE
ncbi:MAG TPA: excinuclease ABC subunit UvrC [Candidatus Ornithoclostridium excrementipullorum]|nr:excinuclease ABC subunit UvrC [Candidatus Ornithoclostridium excrementipullorum]